MYDYFFASYVRAFLDSGMRFRGDGDPVEQLGSYQFEHSSLVIAVT